MGNIYHLFLNSTSHCTAFERYGPSDPKYCPETTSPVKAAALKMSVKQARTAANGRDHELSGGQRRRNWKSWRSALAQPFSGAMERAGPNFVVGVMVSFGAFARLTAREIDPHAPDEDAGGLIRPGTVLRPFMRPTLPSC